MLRLPTRLHITVPLKVTVWLIRACVHIYLIGSELGTLLLSLEISFFVCILPEAALIGITFNFILVFV